MQYRVTLVALVVCLLSASCATEVADLVEPDADVPMYEPEIVAPVDVPPAPVADAGAADGESSNPLSPLPVEPTPAPDASVPVEPAPVEPAPAPVVDAGVTPVPVTPPVVVPPAPVVKPTACKLPSGVVLKCANESLYQYRLSWAVYACNSVAAPQCVKGARCEAWHWDNSQTEIGVCQ